MGAGRPRLHAEIGGSYASAYSAPTCLTSAPYPRMRPTFTSGAASVRRPAPESFVFRGTDDVFLVT
jgi:hypothetical protein